MNKVRIFCDIDDTLWDLLPHWVQFNNEQHYKYPNKYDELSTDYLTYTTWEFKDIFSSNLTRGNFFAILNSSKFWNTVYPAVNRYETLRKINNHPNIELYIVTSLKPNQFYKIHRFKRVFGFINENQIITCHDKWVLDGDIWIDDKPETLKKCSEKGKRVIKINRPYNEGVYSDLVINDFSELYVNDKFANMLENVIKEKQGDNYVKRI